MDQNDSKSFVTQENGVDNLGFESESYENGVQHKDNDDSLNTNLNIVIIVKEEEKSITETDINYENKLKNNDKCQQMKGRVLTDESKDDHFKSVEINKNLSNIQDKDKPVSNNQDQPKTNDKKTKMERAHRKLVEFEKEYKKDLENLTLCTRFKTWVRRKKERTSAKKILLSNLPFITMLRNYKRANLVPDLIAGSTAGAMMIPQGMAFGALSTLPPIVGLYISLFAPLTYFFLGTCHQISMGCIAVLSLMMADILDLYDADTKSENSVLFTVMNSTLNNLTEIDSGDISELQTKRIEVACSVTFIVGIITILLSKLGLGFVTCFMSNSLITSFTVGVSIHVFTSQLKNGLGLKLERETGLFKLPKTWYNVCAHITEANIATLITWILCIIIIYLVKAQINERFKKRMKIPIPIELVMVIFGTVASYYIGLNEQYNVSIVKSIPKGIPAPKVPNLSLATDYLGDGILIAVVSYAQTVALAKTFGLMHKYEIDPDQEMFACGGANVICSLFSGYITAASVSRSVVVNGAGAKTQFQSLVACSIVLLVIVVLAPYFFHLPLCVLAAIICVNLRGMFWKLTQLNPLRRQSKTDFTVWVVTFLVAVFVDVIPGLLAGIAVSFILIIIITQQSPVTLKGVIDGTQQTRSPSDYHCVQLSSDVKILHINKPICFANSDIFVQKVFKYSDINPIQEQKKLKNRTKDLIIEGNPNTLENGESNTGRENIELKQEENRNIMLEIHKETSLPRYIILDIATVSFVDLMGTSAIQLVIREFESLDIKVLIANVSGTVFDTFCKTGFTEKHGDCLYLTLNDALLDIKSEDINRTQQIENSEA